LWNETNVDKLKAELLENYDRFNRPEHIQVPTQCHLGITVIHMELDETRGVLETHAWMKMNWSDSKLKWDTKAHGDIYQLNVAADEVRVKSSRTCTHILLLINFKGTFNMFSWIYFFKCYY
jgi:Neurotransmitter-gated ion-channel ligand binding domain